MKPNPFKAEKSRKNTAEESLSEVFGDQKVGEMMSRMTDVSKKEEGLEIADLSADLEKRLEKMRQDYIDWISKYAKDDGSITPWIDEHFEFKPEGVYATGDLILEHLKLTDLPPHLIEVKGDMSISFNHFTSLKGMPQKVGGYLDIGSNPLDTLDFLPKDIGGQLFAQSIPATTFPQGISVGKYIYINEDQTNLIESAKAAGHTVKIHEPKP